MKSADRLFSAAGAVVMMMGLMLAPATGLAQTPPPLPPAADDAGPGNDDLPPPIRRRDGDDDGPPPLNDGDGPPPITRDDDGPPPPPPPPADLAYYVLVDGQQSGPLKRADLIDLIKSGKLTAQTSVWTNGMADWQNAGAVAEMAELIERHAVAAPPPPPPPVQEFFALVNGQQVGPMTQDQLKQAIAAGQISRQTQIWTQGMAQWTAAGQVPELAGLFPPANDNRTGATVRVESYCGATQKSGIGEGPDFNTARERAIKACIANGGLPECCPNSVRQLN